MVEFVPRRNHVRRMLPSTVLRETLRYRARTIASLWYPSSVQSHDRWRLLGSLQQVKWMHTGARRNTLVVVLIVYLQVQSAELRCL